jgi:hypothetical protein
LASILFLKIRFFGAEKVIRGEKIHLLTIDFYA